MTHDVRPTLHYHDPNWLLTIAGEPSGHVTVTSVRTLAQLHQMWLAKVGRTPARMLDYLLRSYPDAVSRALLADVLSVSHETGTFRNNLGTLRTLGLLEDVDKQHVKASALLFPKGLR